MSDAAFAALRHGEATAFAASAEGTRAAKGCWSPRGFLSRVRGCNGPEPTKRPTSFAVGRNVREIRDTQLRWPNDGLFPGNAQYLNDRGVRLKIVVSPVRVRVSPSAIPHSSGDFLLFGLSHSSVHWALDWAPGRPLGVTVVGKEPTAGAGFAGLVRDEDNTTRARGALSSRARGGRSSCSGPVAQRRNGRLSGRREGDDRPTWMAAVCCAPENSA